MEYRAPDSSSECKVGRKPLSIVSKYSIKYS